MLIVHPSSSCDVCLEPFRPGVEGSADARPPCAIQCGHVFCKTCIDSFTRLLCPFCRCYFDPRSVRRLHVDLSNTPQSSPVRAPAGIPTDTDAAATHVKDELKARLADMVREGAGAARFQALLGEVASWLKEQSRDDHWDLRALYLLVIRYHEMHKEEQIARFDLKTAQDEIARLRAHEGDAEQRHFELSEALELLEREKSELEDELRECEASWTDKYNVSLSEIASLREEILFFSSQKSRPHAHVSPMRLSGLSISRPQIEDTDDDAPPPPPPPPPPPLPLESKAEESELEGIDLARFSPLGIDQGFSPLDDRPEGDELVSPQLSSLRSPQADAPSKPLSSKPLAITDVAARFYETIGSAPGASSSLPHPAPASYYARRQERTRADGTVSRHRSNSSNTPPRPRLSSKMQQRVSRLQLALVPDSSDEGEIMRRAQRQVALKDLLADPSRMPRRASINESPPRLPPPPPPPPPAIRSGPGVVSHASTAAQAVEREREERRRTQSGSALLQQQQQQQPQQQYTAPLPSPTPKQQLDGFGFGLPSTPPAQEPRRPRYLERRDSAASASTRAAFEAERARVWLPTAAGMESEA